jgi:hypothetical protein
VPDSLGLEGEQQDECAGCPGLDGQLLAGQAALQEMPALVVVEQIGGFLARDKRDGELTAEAASRGPVQEVADAVAALGIFPVEPSVEVVLAEVSQGDFLGIDPGQKVQGHQDPAAQVAAGGGGIGALACAIAGTAQQIPAEVRADEVGVLGRLVGQVVVEPARNPLEVLVPFGKHARLHHHLPEMLERDGGR